MNSPTQLTPADLAAVIYTSGKVFDGLRTDRLNTEGFLRSGDLAGIASRADLAILEDLRDVAQFVIDTHVGSGPGSDAGTDAGTGHRIDADYVCAVNSRITRSGPLHPGELRKAAQDIGVSTVYGRHQPPALTRGQLQELCATAQRGRSALDGAISLFITLARAQPFEDGNKRTALFVANGLLLGRGAGTLLVVPQDDDDPAVSAEFNDLLARAYIYGEDRGVATLMKNKGVIDMPVSE